MTSFYTLSINFITHEPSFILSFITSTRPFFNSSIVPSILSEETEDSITERTFDLWERGWELNYPFDNLLWEKLAAKDIQLKWYQLFILSDTLQFARGMWLPKNSKGTDFIEKILSPLLQNNFYFARTLKHFTTFSGNLAEIFPLLSGIPSLESLTLHWVSSVNTVSLLKGLRLKKTQIRFFP